MPYCLIKYPAVYSSDALKLGLLNLLHFVMIQEVHFPLLKLHYQCVMCSGWVWLCCLAGIFICIYNQFKHSLFVCLYAEAETNSKQGSYTANIASWCLFRMVVVSAASRCHGSAVKETKYT